MSTVEKQVNNSIYFQFRSEYNNFFEQADKNFGGYVKFRNNFIALFPNIRHGDMTPNEQLDKLDTEIEYLKDNLLSTGWKLEGLNELIDLHRHFMKNYSGFFGFQANLFDRIEHHDDLARCRLILNIVNSDLFKAGEILQEVNRFLGNSRSKLYKSFFTELDITNKKFSKIIVLEEDLLNAIGNFNSQGPQALRIFCQNMINEPFRKEYYKNNFSRLNTEDPFTTWFSTILFK
ncbi:MAG: hypothetical protein RIA69_07245 [Cyclobacteriaceae bacterium]